jgi:hypothetical protein
VTVRLSLTVLGALLIAALVAYGAFELIDLASRHSFDVAATYGGVRSLEVDGGTGDVHLIGGAAGNSVVVVEHVTEGLSTPDRKAVRGASGALNISATCSVSISNNCGVSTTAPLKLSSGDGDVNAVGIEAGNVTLESGNGDVTATLDRAPTRLDASSGNGDVTLTVPNTTYAVHASSGNGTVSDQTLQTDPSSPRSITASSGNGDVTIQAAGVAAR